MQGPHAAHTQRNGQSEPGHAGTDNEDAVNSGHDFLFEINSDVAATIYGGATSPSRGKDRGRACLRDEADYASLNSAFRARFDLRCQIR
jgi:hypothetical protein